MRYALRLPYAPSPFYYSTYRPPRSLPFFPPRVSPDLPMLSSLRIPAFLLVSILLVNALFFPGAQQVIVQLGPAALTVDGLAFGAVSAGRLLVVFLASVLDRKSTRLNSSHT